MTLISPVLRRMPNPNPTEETPYPCRYPTDLQVFLLSFFPSKTVEAMAMFSRRCYHTTRAFARQVVAQRWPDIFEKEKGNPYRDWIAIYRAKMSVLRNLASGDCKLKFITNVDTRGGLSFEQGNRALVMARHNIAHLVDLNRGLIENKIDRALSSKGAYLWHCDDKQLRGWSRHTGQLIVDLQLTFTPVIEEVNERIYLASFDFSRCFLMNPVDHTFQEISPP